MFRGTNPFSKTEILGILAGITDVVPIDIVNDGVVTTSSSAMQRVYSGCSPQSEGIDKETLPSLLHPVEGVAAESNDTATMRQKRYKVRAEVLDNHATPRKIS